MKKEELKKRVEELEKEIDELKSELEKKETVGEIWKPKRNEKYYYINYTCDNGVDSYINNLDNVDSRLIESGNCYQTGEKAEFEANREKYTRLFRQYVEQHSEPLDWNDRYCKKFMTYYNYNKKEIEYWTYDENDSFIMKDAFQIYASSEEVIQEAIEFIGEDNFKKYILEIGE